MEKSGKTDLQMHYSYMGARRAAGHGPGWQLQIARMYCTFQKVRRKDWGTPHHQCKYLQRIYLLILVLYNVYVVQMNSAY